MNHLAQQISDELRLLIESPKTGDFSDTVKMTRTLWFGSEGWRVVR